jgi:hypothetical protein
MVTQAPGKHDAERLSLGSSPSVAASAAIGSVSTRASKYSRSDEGRDFSSGLQHTQNRCGAAKEVEPAVAGGDFLMGAGTGAEEVA